MGSASSQVASSPQTGSTNTKLGRNANNAGAQYQAGVTSSQAAISPQAGSTNPQPEGMQALNPRQAALLPRQLVLPRQAALIPS